MDAALPPSPAQTARQLLDHLAIADPEAAERMRRHLTNSKPAVDAALLARVVDEVIQALAIEVSFGRHLADGMARMLAGGTPPDLDRYRSMVNTAAAQGPTLAGLFARYLVPVLTCGDNRLAQRVEETTRIMMQKGTYTLKAPLEALSTLIENKELACAHAFLDLLATTYALKISYNRTVYLTHTLPRAVDGFAPARRLSQIRGLARIIRLDERLADDFLQGLASGLHLLSDGALNQFLDQAVRRYRKAPDLGARFLSLESRQAIEICRELQVAVPLSAVRSRLERYLHARTGLAVAVRPLSALSHKQADSHTGIPVVRCDGRAIYLPDEMDLMESRDDNAALCHLLASLEAGAIEFGTFDLDVEKAVDGAAIAPPETPPAPTTESDLDRLLHRFEDPLLALDLFTLFEHGRVARRVNRAYPGLFRRFTNALTDSHLQAKTGHPIGGTWFPLYRHLVMNEALVADPYLMPVFLKMADRLSQESVSGNDTVETSARLTIEFYSTLAGLAAPHGGSGYQPLSLPFGRRLAPSLFGPFHTAYHRLAVDIHKHLAQQHIQVYRSDVRHLFVHQNGQVSTADIRNLIANRSAKTDHSTPVDLSVQALESLMCNHGLGQPAKDDDGANAFRYREWDRCMADYLPDRVRVLERDIQGSDPAFYRQTLDEFRGLVGRTRYAFELLRPEEMTILRQWREGDAFDYRALLDYALDKKAGLMPSDRLFIKRMKRVRDVAALLLVDLSRSTANTVDQRGTRVLDVEKQAIVLLCEALKVVGDRFAIAGFSGTGPLGVDYYRIKDLGAPFDDSVKGRISAMAPQRSTRMGAAIRHATALLAPVQARVRLIIILGDGFPNDLAYKGAYAVEDTRRAVMEARSAAIHVKAITINVSDNGRLDRLYGSTHHTLIGNVHDLPDKLVRVYSALTRH
jgi:nitric oxide reductase NorD protein